MIGRMTIEIPAEYLDAIRLERFQNRTTYREIISDMFAARYGLQKVQKTRRNRRKGEQPTKEGSTTGAGCPAVPGGVNG